LVQGLKPQGAYLREQLVRFVPLTLPCCGNAAHTAVPTAEQSFYSSSACFVLIFFSTCMKFGMLLLRLPRYPYITTEYIYGPHAIWFCSFSFTPPPKTPVKIFDMKREIPARMRQSETRRSDTQSPGPDPTAATKELPDYDDDNGNNDRGVSTWLELTPVKN